MCMLTASAWIHARLTVVGMIHVTDSPEQMLRRMLWDTVWVIVAVTICYHTLGPLGTWITLFAIARSMFLLFTNWEAVCYNFHEIKKLLSGS